MIVVEPGTVGEAGSLIFVANSFLLPIWPLKVGTNEAIYDDTSCVIQNCYNIGRIESLLENGIGSIVGVNKNDVKNTYYLLGTAIGGINSTDVPGQAEVRSAEFMKSKYFVKELGEENWKIAPGVNDGYPVLSWLAGEKIEPEFETVSTAQALKDMAHIVNDMGETFEGKTVTQQNDIDLSTVCSETLGNWIPIGDYGTNTNLYFAGTFEGNGNTISNLYINASENDYQGLFGYTNHATVSNLIIERIKILGRYNIGSIIGVDADSSRIYNTHIRSGELIGSGCVGGITGITNGNIIKCTNYSSVSSYSANVEEWAIGGISGGSYSLGKIEQCINYGTIVGLKYVGGIVGVNWCYTLNCYNVGTVKSNNTQNCIYIAGIVGYQNLENGRLENCYNIGKIEGNSNADSIAEIIGGYEKGVVNNCYYLDKNNNLKGIYYNDFTTSWRQDVPGQAEAKTGTFMKSSEFVNLLGNSNWKLVAGENNGYPILSWQNGTPITVNNYDIYWNGVLSNPVTSNEFTGWSYKGTVEFKENCITLTSSVINQLNEIRTTDKLNLTDYNTIVIRKTNVNLTRLYFVTGNLGMVNQEIIPFTFASKTAMNVGNDTWICDIRNENYEGWLGISSYSRDNDGDIYEMYLSTKTVEQIKAEYEN